MHGTELRRKLAEETGQITWQELERHFARGALIVIGPELNLVETAARIAEDDAVSVQGWIQRGQVVRATDEHARRWVHSRSRLWAVVVAPWVLVQESEPPKIH
ncbi:DUF2288 domain-containing protein [Methylocaldum szegediense]|jgi:hypothetical protein|uniref:DUF2288 domain-containing protein n=1 Tax=Methylocaldum szegediense TaxID=73780 RepID=A0ABM9I062_9GAMM|nr:DUF2288 domain-containing protein [Methylocaldum szegediense]CAI8801604.1 conserved protein of unknown function [Methylocaldum szegediense]